MTQEQTELFLKHYNDFLDMVLDLKETPKWFEEEKKLYRSLNCQERAKEIAHLLTEYINKSQQRCDNQ